MQKKGQKKHKIVVAVLSVLLAGAVCGVLVLGYQLLWAVIAQEDAEARSERYQRQLERKTEENEAIRKQLDEQFELQDALLDQQDEGQENATSLRLQNAQLKREIDAYQNTKFVGKQIGISLILPEAMRAMEWKGAVYLSTKSDAVYGLIRAIGDETGKAIKGGEHSLQYAAEYLMGQMGYEKDAYPERKNVLLDGGKGIRFSAEVTAEDGNKQYEEVCLMEGKKGVYCLEVETDFVHKAQAADCMDQLLDQIELT